MARPPKQRTPYPALARFQRELPPPNELALLASLLAPHEFTDEALRRAAKFYLEAAEFCDAYEKAPLEERARLCGELFIPVIAKLREHVSFISTPEQFPASYDEFLKLVVDTDEANATAKLRHFFASEPFPTYEQSRLLANFRDATERQGVSEPDKPLTEQEKYQVVSGLERAGDKPWPEDAVKDERFFYIQIGNSETAHKFRACSTDGEVVSEFYETQDAVRQWLKRRKRTVCTGKGDRLPAILEPSDHIALLKKRGFRSLYEWRHYAYHYARWHRKCVANQNRANRLGKTKQPPPPGA